jgi:hypothetical protein
LIVGGTEVYNLAVEDGNNQANFKFDRPGFIEDPSTTRSTPDGRSGLKAKSG